MLNKLLSMRNKKGFTLVEIIVVLVILAIIAAAGIPSLIGFIGDARARAFVAEARTVYMAAQTTSSRDAMLATPTITSNEIAVTSFTTAGNILTAMNDQLRPDITLAAALTFGSNAIWNIVWVDGQIRGLLYRTGGTRPYYILVRPGDEAMAGRSTAVPASGAPAIPADIVAAFNAIPTT
jgi:type IV pilus assembly protein PilA